MLSLRILLSKILVPPLFDSPQFIRSMSTVKHHRAAFYLVWWEQHLLQNMSVSSARAAGPTLRIPAQPGAVCAVWWPFKVPTDATCQRQHQLSPAISYVQLCWYGPRPAPAAFHWIFSVPCAEVSWENEIWGLFHLILSLMLDKSSQSLQKNAPVLSNF